MKLIYTPEGGERKAFEVDFSQLLNQEAERIEDAGGETWDSWYQFIDKFNKGNRRALRAYLWVMLRRTDPKLRFADLTFHVNELEVDFDSEELAELRERINEAGLSEAERDELLAEIDAAIERDTEAATEAAEVGPKDSEIDASPTNSASARLA